MINKSTAFAQIFTSTFINKVDSIVAVCPFFMKKLEPPPSELTLDIIANYDTFFSKNGYVFLDNVNAVESDIISIKSFTTIYLPCALQPTTNYALGRVAFRFDLSIIQQPFDFLSANLKIYVIGKNTVVPEGITEEERYLSISEFLPATIPPTKQDFNNFNAEQRGSVLLNDLGFFVYNAIPLTLGWVETWNKNITIFIGLRFSYDVITEYVENFPPLNAEYVQIESAKETATHKPILSVTYRPFLAEADDFTVIETFIKEYIPSVFFNISSFNLNSFAFFIAKTNILLFAEIKIKSLSSESNLNIQAVFNTIVLNSLSNRITTNNNIIFNTAIIDSLSSESNLNIEAVFSTTAVKSLEFINTFETVQAFSTTAVKSLSSESNLNVETVFSTTAVKSLEFINTIETVQAFSTTAVKSLEFINTIETVQAFSTTAIKSLEFVQTANTVLVFDTNIVNKNLFVVKEILSQNALVNVCNTTSFLNVTQIARVLLTSVTKLFVVQKILDFKPLLSKINSESFVKTTYPAQEFCASFLDCYPFAYSQTNITAFFQSNLNSFNSAKVPLSVGTITNLNIFNRIYSTKIILNFNSVQVKETFSNYAETINIFSSDNISTIESNLLLLQVFLKRNSFIYDISLVRTFFEQYNIGITTKRTQVTYNIRSPVQVRIQEIYNIKNVIKKRDFVTYDITDRISNRVFFNYSIFEALDNFNIIKKNVQIFLDTVDISNSVINFDITLSKNNFANSLVFEVFDTIMEEIKKHLLTQEDILKIIIDGVEFSFLLDDFVFKNTIKNDSGFINKVYTVNGRSKTVIAHDSIYTELITKTWEEDILFYDLVEEVLEGKDLIILNSFQNFIVPLGFSADKESPLSVLDKILKDVGGIIKSGRKGELIIEQKYNDPVNTLLLNLNAITTICFSDTIQTEFNNDYDFVQIDEKSLTGVTDNSDEEILIELDAERNNNKTVFKPGEGAYLRIFTVPFSHKLIQNLFPSDAVVTFINTFYTEIIEDFSVSEGAATLKYPIFEIVEITWTSRNLGQAQFKIGEKWLKFEITENCAGVSKGTVVYKSKYYSYSVLYNKEGTVNLCLE